MWNHDMYQPGKQASHFLTLNTVDCVDIFIRPVYKQVIVHTLNHFIDSKGLVVFSWCLMTNHLHLLVQPQDGYSIEEIEQEYKAFTTQKILAAMETEPETRKDWMLKRFEGYVNDPGKIRQYNIWQNRSSRSIIEMDKPAGLVEYYEYIHENPVRERFVDHAPDFPYSSARDYAGSRGLVNITKLPSIEQLLAASESFSGSFLVKHVRN
ncbi:transposase [Terrimonas sp. NA20]|uniref:Transposase n=1 Tax=Terrimonas ginsenosidimutans TaxID=2908004 RepID=A0ABS9KL63_9BACT|nr:transposase [Terrimonas ginsenosidimutans]MCG2613059.1 transposase [Terrimonas ginsenosidimutans]